MSTTTPARKPPTNPLNGRNPSPNPPSSSPGSANRTPARPSASSSGANGVQRTRSLRNGTPVSARASVRKPGAPSTLSQSTSPPPGADEEAAREEAAAALHELKERLQKAETEVEERQKQIEVLNSRLDEALTEQSKLEERAHEEEEKVEALENEKRELTRQHRELEGIYEAERAQTMKEKEEWHTKEEGMQQTIQRLKETLAMKDMRANDSEEGSSLSRTTSFRNTSRSNSSQNLDNPGQFAPPSSIRRSDSQNNSKLIHQKDKIIEGLRLELAEVQIKLVEMENMGGGRMRELERQLLETRMTNARLMEDNESFQLLLSEKTLNGDFSRGDFMRGTSVGLEERVPSSHGPATSLADELESAEGTDVETIRRLESEVNSMKDQNKALTLYINKIIERLLQHQGFESILDKTDLEPSAPAVNTNKELPPPPPPKESQQPSLLQRAKSVAIGGGRGKPRPLSHQAPSPAVGTVNEDPSTAPSIPIQRSQSVRLSGNYTAHRRSNSEWHNPAAASVVNNMYRNPPPAAVPGQASPGIVSPRNSFFGIPLGGAGGPTSNPASRVPSSGAPIEEERDDSTSASASRPGSIDTPSPPRSNTSAGVMTGRQMRPLRLVAAEEEATRARKAANRGSWLPGWFGGLQGDKGGENTTPE
ncbi:hypothetical protein GQ43DRAFT_471083 [Delitschia confertaspora ATCC 74209]|uniref:M protein, serotype 2.1 n=1 Tax=Delitschia confertaspora ATCC 74209 TaxID=1513339 RepID=A0A9P4JML4_9PLEO|nr:hypothetical protein GQ43DRAFT_471083 [Delitschia confertaspora ATCC 74209]